MTETIRALAGASPADAGHDDGDRAEAALRIAECNQKLAQYRAALDAGASAATVAAWMAETEADKQTYALVMRLSSPARA